MRAREGVGVHVQEMGKNVLGPKLPPPPKRASKFSCTLAGLACCPRAIKVNNPVSHSALQQQVSRGVGVGAFLRKGTVCAFSLLSLAGRTAEPCLRTAAVHCKRAHLENIGGL